MWLRESLKRVRNRFHRDITTLLEELIKDNKSLLKDNQLLLRENEQLRADILSRRQLFKEEMTSSFKTLESSLNKAIKSLTRI